MSLNRHYNNNLSCTFRIIMKAQTPNMELGSSSVTVNDDMVTVSRLIAIPVVEMSLNVEQSIGKRAQYDVITTLETVFHHRYQHGSFTYQLFYSDETMEFLDDIIITDFVLSSQSTDERVLAITHKIQNGVDMIALDDLNDPLVEFELRPPSHCSDIDAIPLATYNVLMRIEFEGHDSRRLAAARYANNATISTQLSDEASFWRVDSVLTMILVFILVVGIVRLFSKKATNFKGYEKLVAPLLSRLSSSSSGCERDEDSKEWVWLGKARNDTNSVGSHCSQKSTVHITEQSSPSYDDTTQASISYRGSEISVFISPTPIVTVHADYELPCGGSWRSSRKARGRTTRHALIDSSSDHNLARVVARSDSWKDEAVWPTSTWSAKKRTTIYEGMRESVA
ncbi:hypothetical protein DICVIV_08561 [Dictyocaulus viviparus]|uniref:Transmembrane protein TMEM132 sixth domain-containing protein n=1 Tax=Dictyocaulus viviparus TaxID=29172 RepID=A0A0D8XNM1_DICVI|nr:hypothetical protein DICVIV_08561 [Dictyocaulus viviparus]